MEVKNFSIRESLKFGFQKTIEHIELFLKLYGFVLGIFFAISASAYILLYLFAGLDITTFINYLIGTVDYRRGGALISAVFFGLQIGLAIFSIYIQIGLISICLEIKDFNRSSVDHLFSKNNLFFSFFLLQILLALAFLVGLIALIIPGIWVLVRTSLASIALVDKNLDAGKAFNYSFALTKGVALKLFWFICVTGLINLISILGIFIFFVPCTLAWIYAYRTLDTQTKSAIVQ